jgi:glycosyltransferase involved in cell wall biosynthesis
MKLNWFSPLPPARSGIADYTFGILPVLIKHAEVTLWTDQYEWNPAIERYAVVRQYQPERIDWRELNRADLSFYHIGNNHLFHTSIWQVSRRSAGIVILHDFRLHDFFESLYRGKWRDQHGYLALMDTYYGHEGLKAAIEFVSAEHADHYLMAQRYPLTLPALENALGALVHTREAFEELRLSNRFPVVYAPLPSPVGSRRHTPRPSENPYRLIIFGHMGRNRRLNAVLEALAQVPERNRFRLDIYGEMDDAKALRSEIHKWNLKEMVSVHGYAPESELDQALDAASLAINLRYPTMGEASASQLRIWDHALPSLVTKVGWYGSLSGEIVGHVRPEHEVADIRSHLESFLENPARYVRMGERGYRFVKEEHDAETYAKTIVSLVSDARNFMLRKTAYDLARRTGALIGSWSSPKSIGDLPRKVAEKIHTLSHKEA